MARNMAKKPEVWRNSSVVKSTCSSSKGSDLQSQHPHHSRLHTGTHGHILTCRRTHLHMIKSNKINPIKDIIREEKDICFLLRIALVTF